MEPKRERKTLASALSCRSFELEMDQAIVLRTVSGEEYDLRHQQELRRGGWEDLCGAPVQSVALIHQLQNVFLVTHPEAPAWSDTSLNYFDTDGQTTLRAYFDHFY